MDAPSRYPDMMDEENSELTGLMAAIRARSGVIIALLGLVAWGGLVWFMIGDVL